MCHNLLVTHCFSPYFTVNSLHSDRSFAINFFFNNRTNYFEMNNLKKATGLTGLAVASNPVYSLNSLYAKILRLLANIPQEAAYRKYTEEIINKRSAIINEAKSVKEIEEKLNAGLVEEVIIQAENELKLIRNFAYSKPWESLISSPPPDQWKWPPSK